MFFVIPSEVEESPWRYPPLRLRDVSTALDMTNVSDRAGFSERFIGTVFVNCL